MARTRTPSLDPDSLQAAAIQLIDKGNSSLLYNSQVVDYLTNSVQSGNTHLAWYYLSKIPELRYTCRYISNALSVATLYVGEVNSEGEPIRVPEGHPAIDLLNDFAGGYAGQSDLLDRLALHLTVVGDSVLIGPANGSGGEPPFDQWRVYSTEEVSARSGKIFLKMPGNSREQQIPNSCLAVRIWRPHPRDYWDADSPVKGSFSVLRELDLLDQHVHASAVSRLAGAGLLGIPEELDLPTGDAEIDGTETDRFVAMLTEIMSLAIKNRESAAAMVPIILRGPAEFIEKIKHFDFSTSFAAEVPELRLGAIRRLALGMDVPPEVLLGSADSTSWSAWQTDESTLRVHLVPLLQLIVNSLTIGWLRPALEKLPLSDVQQKQIPNLVIHYDISKLKIRQDVSGDAQALYDRLEIDSDALRLATGYAADSAPGSKDLAKQVLLQLVRGNPDLAMYAIKGLRENFNITMLPEPPDPNAAAGGAPEGEAAEDELTAPPPVPGASGPGAPKETPSPETTPVDGPLPGKRSQDKQTSPPPPPKAVDPNNNAEGMA